MSNRIYGYVRVSSLGQNEARQILAMRQAEVDRHNIYVDKASGKDFERPGYKRVIKKLRSGDTLVVKSIDRLGRNYKEILEQWHYITKVKQAAVRVLDMPLLNTHSDRDLTGTLIADIVLELLSYFAETERQMIRQRQREGIAAAVAKGVHFGRPCKVPPVQFADIYDDYIQGQLSARAAARKLGVSPQTFIKWSKNAGK